MIEERRKETLASGKRKYNKGLIDQAIEHYEEALQDDDLISDMIFKARLQVDFSRKLIELELFQKAQDLLEEAEQELGEIDMTDEGQTVAFWKIRYSLGKLYFRSMYQ